MPAVLTVTGVVGCRPPQSGRHWPLCCHDSAGAARWVLVAAGPPHSSHGRPLVGVPGSPWWKRFSHPFPSPSHTLDFLVSLLLVPQLLWLRRLVGSGGGEGERARTPGNRSLPHWRGHGTAVVTMGDSRCCLRGSRGTQQCHSCTRSQKNWKQGLEQVRTVFIAALLTVIKRWK